MKVLSHSLIFKKKKSKNWLTKRFEDEKKTSQRDERTKLAAYTFEICS